MKQEEYNFLKEEKIKDGKSLEQAKSEIKRLQDSQVHFKNLDKEVKKLERQLKIRDNKIEKLMKQRLFEPQSKLKEVKNSNGDLATVKDVKRVIAFFDSYGKLSLNEITTGCYLKPKTCKCILNFLMSINLIKEDITKKQGLYFERKWKEGINKNGRIYITI